jgi:hypothetical protein
LKERLRIFVLALNTKWQKSGRAELYFLKVNAAWLNLEFIFPDAILDEISDLMDTTDSQNLSGSKKFSHCSDRHKRRKTKPLRELDPEELCYAKK